MITEIRRLLGELGQVAFDKRYFKLEGRRFQVHLEPDWTLETTKLYIGIETTELTDAQCDELMSKNMTDWKLGSGDQVDTIFTEGARRAENESPEPHPSSPARRLCVF